MLGLMKTVVSVFCAFWVSSVCESLRNFGPTLKTHPIGATRLFTERTQCNRNFEIPHGFGSAPSVPQQCPTSAPTVPHDSAPYQFRIRKNARTPRKKEIKIRVHTFPSAAASACKLFTRVLFI